MTVHVWCVLFCRDAHSVLVHGSEGTDNTLLVSSLAQLILDPASRSLSGFLCLLERDWIQVNLCETFLVNFVKAQQSHAPTVDQKVD